MYPWRIIRLTCIALLAIPILHLGFLLARDANQIMDGSPAAFQHDLERYLKQDAQHGTPANPILVVGGRRVKLWQSLPQALTPRPVLMRGLGDAIVEDITYNYPHLIGLYQPRVVVLLPGSSEFLLRADKSGEELAQSIRDLAELDASQGMSEQFYVVSPIKTPLRPQDHARIDTAMGLLSGWASANAHATLLDANALLADADGRPDTTHFRGDGQQLNELGYLRLTLLLHTQLALNHPFSAD